MLIIRMEKRNPAGAVSLECQKVLCFSFLRHMIGFKHRATFSSNQKKLTVTSLHTFSRTSRHLHVLSLSFDWLIEFSMFSSILLSEMQFKTLIWLNIDKPQSKVTWH